MDNVIIIKNKLNANYSGTTRINIANAEESLSKGEQKEYESREADAALLAEYIKSHDHRAYILLVSYNNLGRIDTKNINNTEIENIFIGEADIVPVSGFEKCNIKYRMYKKIENKKVIINLLDGIDMNLAEDYEAGSYVMVRKIASLAGTVRDMLTMPLPGKMKEDYMKHTEEYVLADYAQHNCMCKRAYGLLKEDVSRNEFQRDRERIVNSRAFRRLVDKAQVFSAEKGDHYRTRMTHTLEVNQIAKAISASLSLNLDLTEAIALAHDLGHTPFGHQGERTLRDILYGIECTGLFHININNFDYEKQLGGFKHNYQGVRVLSKLEEKYVDYAGLDISFQVLEGILKHTRLKDANINEFIGEEYAGELHIDKPFCVNLEGQVVAIADEIAQRGHDIDDAITSGLIDVEELLESLAAYKFQDLYKKLKKEMEAISSDRRPYINHRELVIGRISSCIVGYFINDVVNQSKKNIEDYGADYTDGIFDERLIKFSKNGEACCLFLEKLINKRVISDSEVAKFDYNAGVVIRKLFESYYKNPKLLHSGTLRKIYVDTLLSQNPQVAGDAIDLMNGNLDIVRQEIEEITNAEIIDLSDEKQKLIFEKRKILIRNIVDYIAGMTDSYAMKEYHKIH